MANNKNPKKKQPGEKAYGTHHFNPGNMSGKAIEQDKKEGERKNDPDRNRDVTISKES